MDKSAVADIVQQPIIRLEAVGGGCIHRCWKAESVQGQFFFIKENSADYLPLFIAEEEGLRALSEGGIKVPQPTACKSSTQRALLVMEYIDNRQPTKKFFQKLAIGLGKLHQEITHRQAGFSSDNFIGLTVQKNPFTDSWIDFFCRWRLHYQFQLARKSGRIERSWESPFSRLCARLPEIIPDDDILSLLHGDLWAGNILCSLDEEPVIVDPAVYYGHREADLAMTELFGGFSSDFHETYVAHYPLVPGYEERRDLYNLYHMLNHLNLFGTPFSAHSIIRRFGTSR